MPWGDGTGPMGYGPMTGRGAGYCAGYGVAGSMNPAFGRRFWGRGGGFRGRGGGRGWRNRFYAAGFPEAWNAPATPWGLPAVGPTREQEMELLQQQTAYFNEALEDIRKRIDELSKEKTG
jgi:hypothetical protein